MYSVNDLGMAVPFVLPSSATWKMHTYSSNCEHIYTNAALVIIIAFHGIDRCELHLAL
jgi:hypothetical protein